MNVSNTRRTIMDTLSYDHFIFHTIDKLCYDIIMKLEDKESNTDVLTVRTIDKNNSFDFDCSFILVFSDVFFSFNSIEFPLVICKC